MTAPRVFTIPPGAPFLPTLVDALLGGSVIDGLDDLSEAVIYLPTRRAARALALHLAKRAPGGALLLPRIVPLGEADGDALDLDGPDLEGAEPLHPPIPPLERRLILTRLVQSWVASVDRAQLRLEADAPFLVSASAADAVNLAGDLEGLMDALAVEEVPWDELADLVEADYSSYFKITLDFLRIAAENWPKILAERNASDPARRRHALLAAEARRLRATRPTTPIIAAGSTGSMPATAALLAAIAHLPRGAVVLPGLDQDLDEGGWRAVGARGLDEVDPAHGHPQAVLRRLLDRIEVARADIRPLGAPAPAARARNRMLSEALRPADTTDAWAAMPAAERTLLSAEGCRGLALVEAHDEREEALCAAIALREALEQPGRVAALVTPDRGLAVRVAAELRRWAVPVEDSAGLALAASEAGRLARLAAEAADQDFAAPRLIALLAHPLVRLSWPRQTLERAASALEIGVLRGPAFEPGLGGLALALQVARAEGGRQPRPRRRLTAEDWDLAAELVRRLAEAFGSFSAGERDAPGLDLVALAADHRQVVEALGCTDAGEPAEAADGSTETLACLFDDLALAASGPIAGRFTDYRDFFSRLARERVVPSEPRGTARVRIYGLLEARLLEADRIVLGGLDEGLWPPRPQSDAFLNRPMRAKLGLAPLERRIGQTAHDFVACLGTPEVVITRAAKRDGAPTVPSRFLQRLHAFAGEAAWQGMRAAGERFRALAHHLDAPRPVSPLPRPAPRPDPGLFPASLSVTEVETLVRDPYSIFARHVLGLDALPPPAAEPGAAERGTLIHEIIAAFTQAHPLRLPDTALEELVQIGADRFAGLAEAFPQLYATWWPRFERFAEAFVIWERERRSEIAAIFPERSGALPIPLPDGAVFTLRARADRIEMGRGGFTIVDFKTGTVPSAREICAGFSPQLTLEAAMLMGGAFRGVPRAAGLPDLLYVRTSGGQRALDPKPVKPGRGDARDLGEIVALHLAELTALVTRFRSGEAAYLSRPYPKFARKHSDYDHLARVQEWSQAGENAAEGSPAR